MIFNSRRVYGSLNPHRLLRGFAAAATLTFAAATFTAPAAQAAPAKPAKVAAAKQAAAKKQAAGKAAAKKPGRSSKRAGLPITTFPYSRRVPGIVTPVVEDDPVPAGTETETSSTALQPSF